MFDIMYRVHAQYVLIGGVFDTSATRSYVLTYLCKKKTMNKKVWKREHVASP